MLKKAFKMSVYPDKHKEYKKRHDELWPEMINLLKKHGAINYSIFLDEETSTLFAYLEIEEEAKWCKTAETEINQKWWNYMKDIMETNPDHSPKTKDLQMVFDL